MEFYKNSGYTAEEVALAARLGTRYCAFTGSVSHACEAAFRALCAPMLGERAILPFDEVILSAACDHALVAAVKACGALPVFVDAGADGSIDVTRLESALSPRTRAVAAQHMGHLFDVKSVRNFCNKYDLWMIEHAASLLGEPYDFDGTIYGAGTVGDVGVSYFSEHVPGGGVVLTRDTTLASLVREARATLLA